MNPLAVVIASKSATATPVRHCRGRPVIEQPAATLVRRVAARLGLSDQN